MSDLNQERRVTRVDAAHPTRTAEPVPLAEPARADAMAMAGGQQAVAGQQIERHAYDLAQKLQQRQRELDRREAEFHARLGEAESELRAARLAANERTAELQQRESSLKQHERETEAVLAKTLQQDLPSAADRHFAATDQQANSEELKLAVERWRKRLREVEQSERQLQSQVSQLSFQRRKMEDECQLQDQALSELTQRLAAEREEERERFEQQLLRLCHREEEMDRRQTAVEQLHADVSRMYREALEMRLCTQQQWAELTESISPAELSKNLAELRRKLMEQFQLGETRVARQRKEIESLLVRLDQHRSSVEEQREEVRQWVIRRTREIEQEAEKLLEREQELNRQISEHRFLEQQWTQQQAGYEQEIRRLRRLAGNATP